MTKTPAPPSSAPRLCPTCGTRVGAAATKRLVCGTDLTGGATRRTLGFSTQPRTAAPPIRISGPLLIVLGVLVIVGIGLVLGASGVLTDLLGAPAHPLPHGAAHCPPRLRRHPLGPAHHVRFPRLRHSRRHREFLQSHRAGS